MAELLERAGAIPAELVERDQWVAWRTELRDGSPTKVPYAPGGGYARTTEPATWGAYADAAGASLDGVGFVFSEADPFCGIDLDDVLTPDGELHPNAERLARLLDSYAEWSPSGAGLHVIMRAALPGGRGRSHGDQPWGGAIEVYDRRRYFAFTGNPLADAPMIVEERQERLDEMLAALDKQQRQRGRRRRGRRGDWEPFERLDFVPCGQRHNYFARYARSLYGKGFAREEVETVIRSANEHATEEPLEEEELEGILGWAVQFEGCD